MGIPLHKQSRTYLFYDDISYQNNWFCEISKEGKVEMSANIGATVCRLHSNRKRNIRKKGKTKSRLFRLREEELYASTAVTLTSMTSSSRFEISSWKKKALGIVE